ncbi:VOC family protein [Streptacidiphilus sp. MAP5-3]|uniref:VOC family protein n=1 Tax=unclassified Streptacidiphilus TaxID=2643834 RepID=UPI0035146E1D
MTTDQPPQGPRPSSVVLFVHQLDESIAFYRELLKLEPRIRTDTAALLSREDGLQVYLRATGAGGARQAGTVGLQYVFWTAVDRDDLDRCEQLLKDRKVLVSAWEADGFRVVEGRDPSDSPVMISFPGPESVPRHDIMDRIYAW